jgi:16S rRNA (guanine527-N7)-methyltransferase
VTSGSNDSCLVEGAHALGLSLTEKQREQFHCFRSLLLDWNQRINLTAITDPAFVFTRHFLDSLTVVLGVHSPGRVVDQQGLRVLDVGAGAGLPGLALAIAFPSWQVTELDATAKKTRFIQTVIDELNLENAQVLTGRAETVAHDRTHREQYDLVTARAVAAIPILAEYTLPFCRVGGRVIMPKKGEIAEEVERGRQAITQLGGTLESNVPVPMLPDLGEDRILVMCMKQGRTPAQFPRQPGVAAKNPL